ncbi:MAG: hypothetical protein WCA13_17935 [Terriglobales bacterium]
MFLGLPFVSSAALKSSLLETLLLVIAPATVVSRSLPRNDHHAF